MNTKHVIGTSLAIVIITSASLLVCSRVSRNPRAVFERLVIKPIPESVRFIDQREHATMDSTFWVLHFQISKSDFQTLLSRQHFAPIDEGEEFRRWDQTSKRYIQTQKEDFLGYWKQRIQYSTKLEVNFAKDSQIFALKEIPGRKYLFFDSNTTDAIFVAEAH